ncbi:MAG: hypothetical protein V2J25_09845 [Desulfatiglans sp.]|jgi:hypothetical protein|nr:hypothetical protein [Thermodesulfobacteriota bacterium]MEE4353160.1 hypothetical protein [Desulfatiglans sp.]
MDIMPPQNPIALDYASQVGVAQDQEKKNEEKRLTIQDAEESERLRLEKERRDKENRKKKKKQGLNQTQEKNLVKDPLAEEHILDIIV